MATRDCIEACSRGLRSYPQRLSCSPSPFARSAAPAIREPDKNADFANDLLGRFSDARCFLQCAMNSLVARDDDGFFSPELVCLRHGLELLRGVYNEVDLRLLRDPGSPLD